MRSSLCCHFIIRLHLNYHFVVSTNMKVVFMIKYNAIPSEIEIDAREGFSKLNRQKRTKMVHQNVFYTLQYLQKLAS